MESNFAPTYTRCCANIIINRYQTIATSAKASYCFPGSHGIFTLSRTGDHHNPFSNVFSFGSQWLKIHSRQLAVLRAARRNLHWHCVGTPLGRTAWLSEAVQETVQSLGYLGLIGLVFEGGMSTSLSQLRKTATMSISIATIGLCLPIALSFLLLVFPFSNGTSTAQPSPLAAFSAGASLCSTSLGTTFAILSAAGLRNTKLGVVLVGAAMMDDVVGLVMVKIVTALGSGDFTAWGIARPMVSSFALLLVTLAVTPYIIRSPFQSTVKWLHDISVS